MSSDYQPPNVSDCEDEIEGHDDFNLESTGNLLQPNSQATSPIPSLVQRNLQPQEDSEVCNNRRRVAW